MNKFLILLILMSLLVSNIIFANVTCQYKGVGQYNETEQLLVDKSNNNQGNIPKFSDFITEENNITSFIIYNPNSFKILVWINFTIEGFGGEGKSYGVDIKPLQNHKVEELCYANGKSGYCFINESSITYFVSTPDSPNLSILYPKNLTLTKTKLVCKLCNDTPCLDDGAECSTNEECGGKYCIEKICNNKPECYLDNCKCERYNKIQCKNTRCVSINTLPDGDNPFCGPTECKTNYTDDRGRCVKSPEQKFEELQELDRIKSKRKVVLLVLGTILTFSIIGMAVYLNKKNVKKRELKAEEKARNAAEREYNKIKQEQESATEEYIKKTNILIQNIKVYEEALSDKKTKISESKKDLDELHKILDERKRKKEEIDSIEKQIEAKRKHISELENDVSIEKSKQEEMTKPYPSYTRGFWVWRNPNIKNAYYPCYANPDINGEHTIKTNIEVHKDLAEKEIFNFYKKWFNTHYSGKNFKDLVVHHVDKDISNFELANLVVISQEEHKKLHKKSQQGNWKSGIEELNENDIKQPHIEELGGKSITDPYEILGIPRNASKEEIKAAYHKLAPLNHPDKVNHLDKQFQILADSRFRKINEAYHKLVD